MPMFMIFINFICFKIFNFDKKFHVSPFMPMDIKYNWKFTEPKDFLYVSMDSFKKDNFNFNATLRLTRKAWTPWALNKILLMFPPTTIRTILAIYWNAFLLTLKRIPFLQPKKMKKISNSICKSIFFNQLKKIKYGSITIIDDKKKYVFGQGRKLSSTIFVRNNSFYFDVLIGGSIGAADSFIENSWETNNLTNVIRIMAINSELTESIESSFNLVVSPILRFLHYLRRNNKKNSLQNIAKHYRSKSIFLVNF